MRPTALHSVKVCFIYGATAEKGVAHELVWHLAVDGRIFEALPT